MSRNLCRTDCRFCEGEVATLEPERPIRASDCGEYNLPAYRGLTVAFAECVDCRAKYLAWMRGPDVWGPHSYGRTHDKGTHFDLSFRSTFNDEPGEDDMLWAVALFMKTASQRTRWWIAGWLRRAADWFADYRRDS